MTQANSKNRTTVGVLSVGDPSLPYCLEAIRAQHQDHFAFELVDHVSPFNAAFQELVSRATTEFLIQVDEDMILYPHAVGRMQEVMEAAPAEIAMVLFYLLDPDREQRIHGIKIFRTAALKKAQSRDVKASEMDLLEQLHELGFSWTIHPETMGRHGILYSADTIYRRYKSMYEKDIATWNVVSLDIRRKAERYAETGDPVELFALLGASHGILGNYSVEDKEKNFREYNSPVLEVLEKCLLSPNPAPFAYDTKRQETRFKSVPIDFSEVAWSTAVPGIEPNKVKENCADLLAAEECICSDISIVEQIPFEHLLQQVHDAPHDPYLRLWLAVSLWYRGAYNEASTCLAQAHSLGASPWRVAWYQALVIKDNTAGWSVSRFKEAHSLVTKVLEAKPNFSAARVFLSYLNPNSLGAGSDQLLEDFFLCNKTATRTFVDVGSASEEGKCNSHVLSQAGWNGLCIESDVNNLRQMEKTYPSDRIMVRQALQFASALAAVPLGAVLNQAAVKEIDLLTIHSKQERYFDNLALTQLGSYRPKLICFSAPQLPQSRNEIGAALRNIKYVLWHFDGQQAYFRAQETLPAPLFWNFKTALPQRQLRNGESNFSQNSRALVALMVNNQGQNSSA
jgi:hypothetical protein